MFSRDKATMEAAVNKASKGYTRDYDDLIEFLADQSKDVYCPDAQELVVAAEELLLNIFSHAYEPGEKGPVSVECGIDRANRKFHLMIRDSGKPFDPTAWGDDTNIRVITCGTESKGIGLFIVKRFLTDMTYRREDGQNVLTPTKTY